MMLLNPRQFEILKNEKIRNFMNILHKFEDIKFFVTDVEIMEDGFKLSDEDYKKLKIFYNYFIKFLVESFFLTEKTINNEEIINFKFKFEKNSKKKIDDLAIEYIIIKDIFVFLFLLDIPGFKTLKRVFYYYYQKSELYSAIKKLDSKYNILNYEYKIKTLKNSLIKHFLLGDIINITFDNMLPCHYMFYNLVCKFFLNHMFLHFNPSKNKNIVFNYHKYYNFYVINNMNLLPILLSELFKKIKELEK